MSDMRPSWKTLFTPLPAPRPVDRQVSIDASRGIGIILVVLGHIVSHGSLPVGHDWYAALKALIYNFHMPFFMVLAGMTLAISLPASTDLRSALRFGWKRSKRLLIPFFAFGLLALGGKVLAPIFIAVDHPAQASLSELYELFVLPSKSAASFLWFIYVLALYYLLLPLAMRASGRRPWLLMIPALGAPLLAWPEAFMLQQVVAYLPLLLLGMLLWQHAMLWRSASRSLRLFWIALFALGLLAALQTEIPKWPLGALAALAVLSSTFFLPKSVMSVLAYLGQYSMSIYLMNMIFIGLAKGVTKLVLPWNGSTFPFYFVLLFFCGLCLPLLVKRLAEKHVASVARYL